MYFEWCLFFGACGALAVGAIEQTNAQELRDELATLRNDLCKHGLGRWKKTKAGHNKFVLAYSEAVDEETIRWRRKYMAIKSLIDVAVAAVALFMAVHKLFGHGGMLDNRPATDATGEWVITEGPGMMSSSSPAATKEDPKAEQAKAADAITGYTKELQEQNRQLAEATQQVIATKTDREALAHRLESTEATLKQLEQRRRQPISWTYDLGVAETIGRATGRPVYVAYSTKPCKDCDAVFAMYEQPDVSQRLRTEFVPCWRFLPTESPEMSRFKFSQFPTGVVIRPDGQASTFVPSQSAEKFLAQLDTYK